MSTNDLPVIIGQTGPLNGQRWEIKQAITIGRDADCEIVIPDRQVSRYHARLSSDGKSALLEDLASKNGTYLNGKAVTKTENLQDGDVIQIALIQYFVFLSSDSTMPLALDHHSASQPIMRGLTMDKNARRVWIDQIELLPPLSLPQFRLLETLYDHLGKVVSRQDLILSIWGDTEAIGVSEQALDALVRRLRDRLYAVDPDHQYLTTIRGHGLRLDNPK